MCKRYFHHLYKIILKVIGDILGKNITGFLNKVWNILNHRNKLEEQGCEQIRLILKLKSSTNIEISEELYHSNFEKIIREILLYLQENMNVITLATCDIGEKTLDVLNAERHIFVSKMRNSFLKYVHHVTQSVFIQKFRFIGQLVGYT